MYPQKNKSCPWVCLNLAQGIVSKNTSKILSCLGCYEKVTPTSEHRLRILNAVLETLTFITQVRNSNSYKIDKFKVDVCSYY